MTVAKVWFLAVWIGIVFFVLRVAVPWLINSQNDGALIAAPLLVLAVGTAAYITYQKVFKEVDNEEA